LDGIDWQIIDGFKSFGLWRLVGFLRDLGLDSDFWPDSGPTCPEQNTGILPLRLRSGQNGDKK
jgi:hypothetical protein